MYKRNTGIRGLLKPHITKEEIDEDNAARAAVLKRVGYVPSYKPVALPLVTESLTTLQTAPTQVKDKFGNTLAQKEKMINDYLTRKPLPSEYKGSWKEYAKQQSAKHANGYKGHIIKKTNFGNVKIIPNKPKLKHELEKEVAELKKKNAVLTKHQKPLPENVEEVLSDYQGQPRGQSTGKVYSMAEGIKMNDQWDRISPQDKKTLRYIEKINYENDATGSSVKPPWMTNEKELAKRPK